MYKQGPRCTTVILCNSVLFSVFIKQTKITFLSQTLVFFMPNEQKYSCRDENTSALQTNGFLMNTQN